VAAPNLATMHRDAAGRLGPCTALRWKRLGLYHDLTWDEYRAQADAVAAALVDLGVHAGDRVGILSENRHEWLVADIGILTAGAADVPLHAPLSPQQVRYQLAHSGAAGVVVGGQAQADKVLASLDELPDLRWIVAFDPIAVPPGCPIRALTWDGLIQRGRLASDATKAEVGRREGAITPGDLATIIYTSGTTGAPKGVMLTHGNLVSNAEATLLARPARHEDVLLSWLPYSHIYARTVDHYLTILAGTTVCLAESADTLVVNLAETQPSLMTAVPRFYEKVWASVEGLPPDARSAALHRLFGPRLHHLSSGGAPLPRHLAEGFQAAGIPLLEGYGLTESSPVISFNRLDRNKAGTVGPPIPGVEVRIADDGEILTRGPHVMKGYWKEPEATAQAIVDGWLHTGDVGYLDEDGFLVITDRKKDLIVTSQGKNIAPAEIEHLLVADPYIDQAVICGDCRPFVSALIVPNFPALEAKAAELGCPVETEGDLVVSEPLRAFLAERIDRLMQAVSQPERVRAFLVLARPFSAQADEVTATLKVRRKFILSKFQDRLDALYQGSKPPQPAVD
jgi:long-chain acyl-CoA synthetase